MNNTGWWFISVVDVEQEPAVFLVLEKQRRPAPPILGDSSCCIEECCPFLWSFNGYFNEFWAYSLVKPLLFPGATNIPQVEVSGSNSTLNRQGKPPILDVPPINTEQLQKSLVEILSLHGRGVVARLWEPVQQFHKGT